MAGYLCKISQILYNMRTCREDRQLKCGKVPAHNIKRMIQCPTRYRTRQFFNNFTINEDIAMKFEEGLPHCVRNVTTS